LATKFRVELSQNSWEYTGYAFIECVNGVVKDKSCDNALFADNVRIEFDEQIGQITEIE
jgi:hypothetical protein